VITRYFWKAAPQCHNNNKTQIYIRLTALCPGLPRWAGTRKVKPIWILLKQEAVSGSSISWAICKSAPRSRQITTPAPYHLVSLRFLQAECPSCHRNNSVKARKAQTINTKHTIKQQMETATRSYKMTNKLTNRKANLTQILWVRASSLSLCWTARLESDISSDLVWSEDQDSSEIMLNKSVVTATRNYSW